MKRKGKIIIAAVMVMLMLVPAAMAALAAAGEVNVSVDKPSPKVGDTVVFTISTAGNLSFEANVEASSNLTFVGAAQNGGQTFLLNETRAAGGPTNDMASSPESFVYTYTVNAAGAFSFTLSGIELFDGQEEYNPANITVAGTVDEGVQPTSSPPPTSRPSNNNDRDSVPPTGDEAMEQSALTSWLIIGTFAVAGAVVATAVGIRKFKKSPNK